MLNNYRYIFIITYARSGSTLLQSLLNSVDGVQIRGENENAPYHIYRASRALADTRKRGETDTAAPDHPWYGAGQVRPWHATRRFLNTFVDEVLAPAQGVRVTGFKEVRHNPFYMSDSQFQDYMDFLLAEFPGASILCNSRDGDKVSQSGFLKNKDPDIVRRDVQIADGWFKTLCGRSDRCLHMRHEETIANPDRLRAMYDFLDLPYDADRVRAVLDKPLTHARDGDSGQDKV